MSKKDYDVLLKILLLGPTTGGKSSIMQRYADNQFPVAHVPTMGIDFGHKINLQIWDTAGREIFRPCTKAYYRNSHALIIIFDLTDQEQFISVQDYLEEIHELASNRVKNSSILIVGNKNDLQKQRESTFEEGMELGIKNNVYYTETSAKSGSSCEIIQLACEFGLAEMSEID